MGARLKDLIREFAPDVVAATPETTTPDLPLSEIDGASALAIVTLLDAVAAVADLLDEETAAIVRGDFAALEDFTRRKQEMIDRLRRVTGEVGAERIILNDELRDMTLRRVARLERSIERNAGGLSAVRSACVAVNRALLTSLERAVGEGMYGRGGQGVRPIELSMSNLNAKF